MAAGEGISERNSPADNKVHGEGRSETEIPLQPTEFHRDAEIHLELVEYPLLEQMDVQGRLWHCEKLMVVQAPGRTCSSMEREAHLDAGLLAELVISGDTHPEEFCSLGALPYGIGNTLELFVKCCSPWESNMCCRSPRMTVSLGWVLTLEQGKGVRKKEY